MIRKGTLRDDAYVASLIIKLLGGEELPPVEQEYLQSWAQRSPTHQSALAELTDRGSIREKLLNLLETDAESEWIQFKQKAGIAEDNLDHEKDQPEGSLPAIIVSGNLRMKFNRLSDPFCGNDNTNPVK